MAELKFRSADASPRVVTIKTRKADIPSIMLWYGSHHAGDRYTVRVDGKLVKKDHNGELMK